MTDLPHNLIIVLAIVVILLTIVLPSFNKYLPKWFCDKMGWHLRPKMIGFDGCSSTGTCPRCNKHVLQDSQGNWF